MALGMEERASRPPCSSKQRCYLSDDAHLFLVTAGAGLGGSAIAVPLLGVPLSWAAYAWLLTSIYAYAVLGPVYLVVSSTVGGGRVRSSGVFLVVGSLLSALVGLGDAGTIVLHHHWLEPVGVRLLVALAWGAATCIGGLAVHHRTIRYVEPC